MKVLVIFEVADGVPTESAWLAGERVADCCPIDAGMVLTLEEIRVVDEIENSK